MAIQVLPLDTIGNLRLKQLDPLRFQAVHTAANQFSAQKHAY